MDLFEPVERLCLEKREDFLDGVPHYGFCAELRCHSGLFSQHIITRTYPKKLYLIDPYWKICEDNGVWDVFTLTVNRVRELDKENCATFIIDDENFLLNIKNGIFDWVYVDTIPEYNRALLELNLLKKKVKRNGWICGNNYITNKRDNRFEVCRAITEWLYKNEDFELYMLDNYSQWVIRRKIINENFGI